MCAAFVDWGSLRGSVDVPRAFEFNTSYLRVVPV